MSTVDLPLGDLDRKVPWSVSGLKIFQLGRFAGLMDLVGGLPSPCMQLPDWPNVRTKHCKML
jgi:hypothetical protein